MSSVPEPSPGLSADTVIDLERQYVLQNYSRYPLVLHRGKGCHVYDAHGNRYLDFIAGIGVNALGHAHPRIVKVIREQAALLIHSSNLYYHEYQGPLAKKLAEISGLAALLFHQQRNRGHGRRAQDDPLARQQDRGSAAGKHEIISLENSFHGRTLGALSITGQAKYRHDFEPLLPGVKFVPANDIAALEAAFSEPTAGMVLELIQGEGGIYPISPEYARKARELADRYNALLVFDEIQCGVGRPGTYFAYQRAKPEVLPDIMVAAKPLACGLPLGVIVANEKAAATIGPGMHGSTFGGSALACRVALEFFDILDGLLPAIQRVGGYLHLMLNELARKHTLRQGGARLRPDDRRGDGDSRQADGAGRHGRRSADQLHARHGAALPAAVHHHRAGRGHGGEGAGKDLRQTERSAGVKSRMVFVDRPGGCAAGLARRPGLGRSFRRQDHGGMGRSAAEGPARRRLDIFAEYLALLDHRKLRPPSLWSAVGIGFFTGSVAAYREGKRPVHAGPHFDLIARTSWSQSEKAAPAVQRVDDAAEENQQEAGVHDVDRHLRDAMLLGEERKTVGPYNVLASKSLAAKRSLGGT